jgi:hypothetical protein
MGEARGAEGDGVSSAVVVGIVIACVLTTGFVMLAVMKFRQTEHDRTPMNEPMDLEENDW